mmetsp:Transcript_16860/g.21991  ORF Transcript_16860/g.21991 Transcript_16860/m.21991 type:complete len:106 (-) Transcript_16860:560-877(-)
MIQAVRPFIILTNSLEDQRRLERVVAEIIPASHKNDKIDPEQATEPLMIDFFSLVKDAVACKEFKEQRATKAELSFEQQTGTGVNLRHLLTLSSLNSGNEETNQQ